MSIRVSKFFDEAGSGQAEMERFVLQPRTPQGVLDHNDEEITLNDYF